ncbi:type III secretion system inner membrane ring lipoprotein SctJ [Chitinivorax sp. PXF-14]|uniref:type III secretion system inner membrane ring lipoprotein SctJ n=1 Tax=Chitinivorax sp. PXF-14 TaxID=3230488 RepID=UPI0034655EBC
MNRKRIAVALAVAVLAGCSKVSLYSQLSEQQANEMLALLMRAEVEADKVYQDKAWSVTTSKGDLPRAVEVLKANGYPKEQYQSLGEIFKKEGFVSSPTEERARLLHGLSQELSKTLSAVDGVIVARVHLSLPEKDILDDKPKPASASVFIKHRPDAKIGNHVAEIKALVVNSVQGLPYDNVTVTLFAADPNLSTGVKVAAMPPRWGDDAALIAGGMVAGVGAIAASRRSRVQDALARLRLRLGRKKPAPGKPAQDKAEPAL